MKNLKATLLILVAFWIGLFIGLSPFGWGTTSYSTQLSISANYLHYPLNLGLSYPFCVTVKNTGDDLNDLGLLISAPDSLDVGGFFANYPTDPNVYWVFNSQTGTSGLPHNLIVQRCFSVKADYKPTFPAVPTLTIYAVHIHNQNQVLGRVTKKVLIQ